MSSNLARGVYPNIVWVGPAVDIERLTGTLGMPNVQNEGHAIYMRDTVRRETVRFARSSLYQLRALSDSGQMFSIAAMHSCHRM